MDNNSTLKHYGILGMKWGVRREDPSGSKSTKKTNSSGSKSTKKTNSSESSFSKFKKKYRKTQANLDYQHIDAKTGEYTHQTKKAKILRGIDRALDVAQGATAIGALAGRALITQSYEDPDDTLKHYGILGMKWGVRRDEITLRERWDSLSRERNWKKVLKEADNMSNEQINAVSKRIRLENDFKKLVKKSNMSRKSDKRDYIQRGQMGDDELSEKVSRLKSKDSLSKSVNEASREQREFGEKVVNAGSTLALAYTTNKTISGKDIYDALTSPQKDATNKIKNKATKALVDSVLKSKQ